MAQHFDGSNSYWTWSSGYGITAWPFSMFVRAKTSVEATDAIFSIGDSSEVQGWSALMFDGDQIIADSGLYSSGTTSNPAEGGTQYETDTWYSIGGNFRATGIDLFVDYAQEKPLSTKTSVSFDSLGSSTGHDRVRAGFLTGATPTNSFEGDAAEAAIWSVELTDAEHAELAAGVSPLKIRPEALVFYARLIEDGEEIVEGTAGTVTGTVTTVDHPVVQDEVQGTRFDNSIEQSAFVGDVAEFNSLGSNMTFETRIKFHSLPASGIGQPFIMKALTESPYAGGFIFDLFNNSVTLRLRARGSRDATFTDELEMVYDWTPVVEQWYTIRMSMDMSAETAYAIIDGVPAAMTKNVDSGSGTAPTDTTQPVRLMGNGIASSSRYIDGTVQYILYSDTYTAEMDLATYPLDEPVDPDDYDLNSIIAFWDFNAAEDGIVPDLINGNNAMMLPILSADFELGDTEYVLVGDLDPAKITGDISFGCWVRHESFSGNNTYLGRYDTGANKRSYLFYVGSGTLYVQIDTNDGTGSSRILHGYNIVAYTQEWIHVFITVDLSTRLGKIFINGTEVTVSNGNTGSGNTINIEDTPLQLGAFLSSGSPTGHLDGRMAHARLYDAYITDLDVIRGEIVTNHSTHANLVGEWKLKEDFLDTGPNGMDGTETSGTIPFVDDSPIQLPGFPYYTGSADFEAGDTEYVDCGDDSSLALTPYMSGGAWIRFESMPGISFDIFSKYDHTTSQRGYHLEVIPSGGGYALKSVVSHDGSSSNYLLVQSSVLNLVVGRWYHVFLAVDASTPEGKVFLDGVDVTSTSSETGSVSQIYQSPQNFTIGAYSPGNQNFFDGQIAHVRLYDAYITQVDQIMEERYSPRSSHPDLVEEWPLTYVDGTTFYATNGNDGAATSGTIPTSFLSNNKLAPYAVASPVPPVIAEILRRKMCNLICS